MQTDNELTINAANTLSNNEKEKKKNAPHIHAAAELGEHIVRRANRAKLLDQHAALA